jgi:hypothetical protein
VFMMVFSCSGVAGFGAGLGELAGFHIFKYILSSWLLSAARSQLSPSAGRSSIKLGYHGGDGTLLAKPSGYATNSRTAELAGFPRSPQAGQDCEDLIVAL